MVEVTEYFVRKNLKKSIKYKEKTTFGQINKFFKRVEKNKSETMKFIKKEVQKEKKSFYMELLQKVTLFYNIIKLIKL